MGKQVEIQINDFSAGVSDSPRGTNPSQFVITKHFDVFSDPKKLTPYTGFISDMDDGSTSTGMKQYVVKDFVYASGTSGRVYGLGKNGSAFTKIVYLANPTSVSWTLPASSEGNGNVKNGCFVEYKDYLWGFQGTTQVWKWGTLSGSPSMTNTAGTVGTITSVAQGVIAKDDQLYLPYNNKLVRVSSGGTVTDAVLTLPTNLKITSICNYGNYLAIACSPIQDYGYGASKVFLWNLTSSDVQEVIDWGEGDLRILENIEGSLVGVTDRYLGSALGLTRGSMVLKMYSGGTPVVIKEIFGSGTNPVVIPTSKVVLKNRVFFTARVYLALNGDYNEGIWSFGRKNVNSPYVVTLDFVDENADSDGIQSFGSAADIFYVSHSGDGSIDRTSGNGGDYQSFLFTSIYESQIFDFGDVFSDKRLESFKLSVSKLLTGQSVVVKYKVDGATSWTTIGTYDTDGGVSRTFLREELGAVDFKSGKEFQFRLESTGGAEITGWKAKATILSNP